MAQAAILAECLALISDRVVSAFAKDSSALLALVDTDKKVPEVKQTDDDQEDTNSKKDKFARQLDEESNKLVLEEFVREPESRLLFVSMSGAERLTCALEVPTSIRRKAVYFLKTHAITDILRPTDLSTKVLCCEVSEAALQTLQLLSQEVFYPLLSNPSNRSGWSGPTAKDVMLRLGGFLAQLTMTVGRSKGRTILPAAPPEAFNDDSLLDQERVHILETVVVQWSHSIQVCCFSSHTSSC